MIRENSAENFPSKYVGKNGIFRGKSFEKLFFFPRNSTEFSAESDFLRKKCTKNQPQCR
jgi:hypothetical protein